MPIMSKVREKVAELYAVVLEEGGASVPSAGFTDDQVLLESGLDSMGFAILVTRIEEELGYDPFVLMSDPVYPRTLGEFLAIYEKYADHATFQ